MWNGMKKGSTTRTEESPLREYLNVPLKDKIRLRWILKKNYQVMYMVKQGDTWYNLTKL